MSAHPGRALKRPRAGGLPKTGVVRVGAEHYAGRVEAPREWRGAGREEVAGRCGLRVRGFS